MVDSANHPARIATLLKDIAALFDSVAQAKPQKGEDGEPSGQTVVGSVVTKEADHFVLEVNIEGDLAPMLARILGSSIHADNCNLRRGSSLSDGSTARVLNTKVFEHRQNFYQKGTRGAVAESDAEALISYLEKMQGFLESRQEDLTAFFTKLRSIEAAAAACNSSDGWRLGAKLTPSFHCSTTGSSSEFDQIRLQILTTDAEFIPTQSQLARGIERVSFAELRSDVPWKDTRMEEFIGGFKGVIVGSLEAFLDQPDLSFKIPAPPIAKPRQEGRFLGPLDRLRNK